MPEFFRLSPADYVGLHRRYSRILRSFRSLSGSVPDPMGEGIPGDLRAELSAKFNAMMRTLHSQKGAHFQVEILADPAVQDFIGSHAATLDRSMERVEMSDAMRQRLTRSNFIFSGMKAFHELNEAFPSLIDENGNRKPFGQFLKEVRSIDSTYNSNYLRAEYNFVQASAGMAAKWEGFMADGDRYHLQYRTAGDDRVRPEHAALNGVTLPPSDPFWEEFYPPNGWNCRCTVVQVRKSKYPATDHDEAMELGNEALQRDTKGMFRFNPGKEGTSVPDYNPYTIRRCRNCDVAKGKTNLVRSTPDNEVCAACELVRSMENGYVIEPTEMGRVRVHIDHGKGERTENLSLAKYFAGRYGHEIDLLPNPPGKKSADVFNHTLGYEQEYKVNTKPTVSAIDNEIRSAARQADNIVLRLDSEISFGDLMNGLTSRVRRCANVESVTLVRNGLDVTYTRDQILSPYFKIKQEDFK